MRCQDCQEIISARTDGAADPHEIAAADLHLTACRACRGFAADVAKLHRAVRIRPAEEVPDLSAAIVARATSGTVGASRRGFGTAPADGRPAPEWPRYVLLTVALTQLLLALPGLLFGIDRDASIHVARELGAFDVALAAGLLVVAFQPRRATGLLPTAAVLCGVVLATATADVLAGEVSLLAESHHLIEVAGLAALWVLARTVPADGVASPLLPVGRRSA